ncbi:hypothetical protein [Clostridium thailandense]|uniref:hypothetical protein n=1 Tax=Clostridium thailandense TaxID=2794346 RepID=UPI003989A9E2
MSNFKEIPIDDNELEIVTGGKKRPTILHTAKCRTCGVRYDSGDSLELMHEADSHTVETNHAGFEYFDKEI